MAYLDSSGLTRFWGKIKAAFGADLTASTTATTASIALKNKAATPDTLGTATIGAATTSAAGVMSADDKSKLNGIALGAEVNVQSDWAQTDTTADDFIKNKPVIPSGAILYDTTGQHTDGAMTQKAATDALATKYVKPSGGIPASDLAQSYYLSSNPSGYQTASQVNSAISAAMTGAAMYKGALASEAAFTALTGYKAGWYYVVSTSWASASLGITLDAGNMLFCKADYATAFNASDWDAIQTDIEAIPNSVIDALS